VGARRGSGRWGRHRTAAAQPEAGARATGRTATRVVGGARASGNTPIRPFCFSHNSVLVTRRRDRNLDSRQAGLATACNMHAYVLLFSYALSLSACRACHYMPSISKHSALHLLPSEAETPRPKAAGIALSTAFRASCLNSDHYRRAIPRERTAGKHGGEAAVREAAPERPSATHGPPPCAVCETAPAQRLAELGVARSSRWTISSIDFVAGGWGCAHGSTRPDEHQTVGTAG
jgi:hypothetical protein